MSILPVLLALTVGVQAASAAALTFKVPAASTECFHEDIEANKKATVQFGVAAGEASGVVMTLKGPKDETLYQGSNNRFDMVTILANVTGTYTACVSNEFSILEHKLVYMNFEVREKSPPRLGESDNTMRDIELSLEKVRRELNAIVDYQTHHRLRETHGRKLAEHLNQHVFVASIVETMIILIIFCGRCISVKMLFN
ncbi:transmembrane emp24 domain-containing protein 7-like [Haemaphysalis longicornis]